jgi:hypothetical protein
MPRSLAGPHQARHDYQRADEPQRLGPHALRHRRRADIIGKCTKGYDDGRGHTYKVHLDGVDQSKFLTTVEGTVGKNNGVKSARNTFFYCDDDGHLVSLRQGDLKYVFSEQRKEGTMGVWAEPFTTLRLASSSISSRTFRTGGHHLQHLWDWLLHHNAGAYGMIDEVGRFAASFKEFPPRSVPPSFNPSDGNGPDPARHPRRAEAARVCFRSRRRIERREVRRLARQ